MKKYNLGSLSVKDKELQDSKEEIVIELLNRMEKYVNEGRETYENAGLTTKEKLKNIKRICNYFCGLSNFLNITMEVEVRCDDGFLYTQEMFNRFFYWQKTLEIELQRELPKEVE